MLPNSSLSSLLLATEKHPLRRTWTKMKPEIFPFLFLLLNVIMRAPLVASRDTIHPSQSLLGNQTLISQGEVFELGFFPTSDRQKYYIGIWYNFEPSYTTVVWVANRNEPVADPSTSWLKLEDGNLVIATRSGLRIHLTNHTVDMPSLTEAVLLDSGNFIIRKRSKTSDIIWQSFDHPTDTWLPGANIGYNRITNERQVLVSWKDPFDPSPGDFSALVEPNSSANFLLYYGSRLYWYNADWRDHIFLSNNYDLVSNENGSYFKYLGSPLYNDISRVVLDAAGQLNQLQWLADAKVWNLLWTPARKCEVYPFCGASTSCNHSDVPICECALENKLDTRPAECTKIMVDLLQKCNGEVNDTFFIFHGAHFSTSPTYYLYFEVDNIEACTSLCLSNCSCTAYAFYDNWCKLYNVKKFTFKFISDWSNILYIRISLSVLEAERRDVKRQSDLSWVLPIAVGCFVISSFVVITLLSIRRRQAYKATGKSDGSLILFKHSQLKRATKNFSEKIGEGSFSAVFKGILPNSTAIAVKRLHCPNQSEKQFHAEVRSIGLLQHVNLVRLHGFCAEGSERFLVFDYMSNGSLASHLFHDDYSETLDWKTRYDIAIGTARGLAYLHEECRECIIHCDIKPDNILLDTDFQPKIADFGLAKLFSRDFSRVLTTTRGTAGYLAPEWISRCPVTTKVDVFSYGKVLFEIISGKRNIDTGGSDICSFFPFQVAYKIVQGEEILSLLDSKLKGLANMEQLERACKVACWCTQDNEKDRPAMSQVVNFLEGVQDLPMPPIPWFFQQIVGSR